MTHQLRFVYRRGGAFAPKRKDTAMQIIRTIDLSVTADDPHEAGEGYCERTVLVEARIEKSDLRTYQLKRLGDLIDAGEIDADDDREMTVRASVTIDARTGQIVDWKLVPIPTC